LRWPPPFIFLHGEFDIGVLVVYGTAVLVSLAHRSGGVPEVARD
jgi:hypothetical protein